MMPTINSVQILTPFIILKINVDWVDKKVTIPMESAVIEDWDNTPVIFD